MIEDADGSGGIRDSDIKAVFTLLIYLVIVFERRLIMMVGY